MEKLKPCPFCGRDMAIYYSSSTNSYYAMHKDDEMICTIVYPVIVYSDKEIRSLSDAYKAWNRRAE